MDLQLDLFLIRHPRPAAPAGLCYGSTDLALAAEEEEGSVAAARLHPLLPQGAFLLSSPLTRCRLLAQALSPAPALDARLQEMHFGRWEGRAWDDIHRVEPHALDLWAQDTANAAPHGGETAQELQARALACVADLERQGVARAVLVTHGGVLKALVGHWLGLPPAQWHRLHFDFGGLSRVQLGTQGPRLLWLNR